MPITFDLPPEVEQRLRAENANLDTEVKEAYALDLFRRGRISHVELSRVLGLDRHETDAYLQRHGIVESSLTSDDVDADCRGR